MIIATVMVLSILLFGGGDFSFEKYYEPFVKDVVEDNVRQEQILDVTKMADKQLAQYYDEVRKVWAGEIKKTYSNFDATLDDYRRVIATADQSRIAMQQGLVDVRFEVIKLMTEQEWEKMYKAIHEKEAEERAKLEKKS
jgi:D-mannonate dehydratase